MLSRLKNLWKASGQKALFENSKSALFLLCYENLTVGSLSWNGSSWHFTYSEEFKNQTDFAPLIDFPDSNKEYSSESLWPFFLHRIPGVDRPEVKKTLEENNVESTNIVEMLRLFGERNISNPYRLLSC